MPSKSFQSSKPHANLFTGPGALAMLAIVFAVLLAQAALLPAKAIADDEAVAYSVDADTGEQTNYTSISSALEAGYTGTTIVMAKDWEPSGKLTVSEGKKLTIDMAGHKIQLGNDVYLAIEKNSELTLTSSKQATFSYKGYSNEDGSQFDAEITSGGLVTGAAVSTTIAAACQLERYATLTLDGVAVAGNRGESAGAIYLSATSTLNMRNGASAERNYGKDRGGAVRLPDGRATINMDDASISKNYCANLGGAICSEGSGATITMNNDSKIDENTAMAGGGIYLSYTNFIIKSEDGTASISGNKCTRSSTHYHKTAQSGGGIHICEYSDDDNKGLIEGITIANNYSAYDGGGIELDQENTVIKNCTITGNTCKYEGGGIYVCEDGNTIENCTITGNACNLNGTNYEGGGIYVWCDYDVVMSGVCIVKGNTRGKDTGNPDDVFLRENAGATAKAYITGSLSKGSSVGVRTGITDDRRIAKNFKCDSNDCFFMDLGGYYVSYGTDEGGDAWQRHREVEFEAKVNGGSLGRYKYGSTVTANGTSRDSSKVFKRWSASESTGLYPFSDYFSDDDLKAPVISFAMPQNDVDLVAEYVRRTNEVRVYVDKPVAGGELPTSGTLAWNADDADWRQVEVTVSWLEKSGDSWVPVSGKAKYGTTYAAVVSVAQSLDDDLAFALDIDASRQQAVIGGQDQGVASASVDASGRLTMQSNPVTTDKPTVVEADVLELEVEEGTSEQDLLAQVPKTVAARTNAGTAVTLDVGTGGADFSGVVSDGKVVRPEGGRATVRLPVSYAGGDVSVPDGMAADLVVTVSDKAEEPVAEPTVSLEGGTYSTTDDADKFVGGRLKVGATCEDGAELRYSLYSYVDGAWSKTAEGASWPEGGVELAAKAGSQAGYKLEVWAVRGDVESVRRTLTYVIDDVRPAETVAVTVKYADTAAEGQHGSRDSETVEVVKGSDAALMASSWPGYSFEKWLAADGTTVLGTDPTLTLEGVTESTTVTALYNPEVSGLDVSFDIPEADKALAGSATKVEARLADSASYVDVTSYFAGADGKVAIAWSPAAREDGSAAHDTCYTAVLTLDAAASGNVKYLLARNAEVLVNNYPVEGAYVVEEGGKTSVCVECPNTGPIEYKSVETLSPIALSFEDALAAKKAQDAGEGTSAWSLPSSVKVNYACGETDSYEITWSSIDGFNESATVAQELTATGTITFPSYVEHDGPTETVTVKLRIAAPKADPEPEPVETHVVTFDTAGGSEVASQTVEDGKCAKEPGTPILDGFEFEGWHLVDGTAYDFSAPVTTDLTLYARWSAKGDPGLAHLVVFETNGGSEIASQTVEDGKCATRPTDDPTRDGYEFAGWYADEDLTEEFDFAKVITADVTVYAKWEAISPEPEPEPEPDPEPDPEPSPSPDPSPEPAPDADADGDDDAGQDEAGQPDGSAKALPGTGDPSSVAAAAATAATGVGALVAAVRFRRRN